MMVPMMMALRWWWILCAERIPCAHFACIFTVTCTFTVCSN
jgi:hypothetical protein